MAFWMYAVVALGWFTGGIVGGATGMGSVMVSMPILMTVFPAGDAVLGGRYVVFQLVGPGFRPVL